MRNEQKAFLNAGISIRNIHLLIAVLTLIISTSLLIATFRAAQGYRLLKEETDNFIVLEDNTRELEEASDYLTEQVRCYAETGDLEFLYNYFKEANETKRRDRALESLRKISDGSAAYNDLKMAMNESVLLMQREFYSMRLTSEVYGYDIQTLPEEIQSVKISDDDEALSKEEKDILARHMVFDETYHERKTAIYSNMNSCLENLEKELSDQQTYTTESFGHMLKVQRVFIIILIAVTLAALLFTLFLLISPLLRAVVYIRADEPIPVRGSKEFRFLAQTYNVMYESNREQKEQLAFDATHDHLTGLYNRSGYDFYIRNTDWDSAALIILDIDKFKRINDENGHETGDMILIKAADIIRKSFRSQDYVCRLGGDEFAVILVHARKDARDAIGSKLDMINAALMDASDGLPATHLSAGIAFGEGRDIEEIFRQADAALYRVKTDGGNGYRFEGDE